MTDYTTEENLLNFVGPTSILLQDTIHLFKKIIGIKLNTQLIQSYQHVQ